MTIFKWTYLGLAIMMLLSACGGNSTASAKLTLTSSKTQVASGEKVTLKVTITEGVANVASVDFAVKTVAPFAKDIKAGADGTYSAESAALTATTTFVATAKNSSGTVIGTSGDVTVTVSASQPKAGNKDVTTLAGIPVVGGTATGLAVVTDKLVVENGTPEKVSEDGGVVTIETDGSFTFTPDGSKNPASFKYKVVSGANSAEGTVTVTLKDLPADTQIVKDAAELTTATATGSTIKTIIVSGTIVCEADPCAGLEAGQKIVGAGVVDGVTLGGVAKLDMTRAGDETTPPENNNFIGVVLAPDTTVEGIEISGRDIYTAINAVDADLRQPGSPVDAPVASTITLKNVSIVGPTSNAPFAIRHETAPFGSYYILNVDGLTVTNATNPMGINAFSSLEFKNSTIDMDIDYVLSAKEFGLSFHAYGDATAVVDKVKITSAKGNPDFAPMKFAQSSAGGTYNITASNNDVSFGDSVDLTAANAYFVNHGNPSPTGGKIIIDTAASKGNTTTSTSPDKARFIASGILDPSAYIEGQLELNGQLVP
jgi:hypothetical protein